MRPPALVAPLDTSVTGPAGTWAVLGMGDLGQPDNTFWQTFYLRPPGGQWTLRTPPGVADNGGLVIANGGPQLVVGFLPSNLLQFSPLALSTDDGATYQTGLVPDGLAAVPDALSVSSTGVAVALTGDQVVTSPPELGNWQPLVALAAVEASTVGRSCGVQRLTAVTALPNAALLGADCTHTTTAGVFAVAGGVLRLVGPQLPVGTAAGALDVLRLVPYRHGLAVLLATNPGPRPTYRAAWEPTLSGPWTLGPALTSGRLLSASLTPAGGFAIVTGETETGGGTGATAAGAGGTSGEPGAGGTTGETGAGGTTGASGSPLLAAVVEPGAAVWSVLPTPPTGTAALVIAGGRTEALGVEGAAFTDDRLMTGRWVAVQTITVPIAFGSSS